MFLPLDVHIEVHHRILQYVGLLILTGSTHTSIDSHRIHTCAWKSVSFNWQHVTYIALGYVPLTSSYKELNAFS